MALDMDVWVALSQASAREAGGIVNGQTMLTLAIAKKLVSGDILVDKNGHRWKVNGSVKLWKTDPNRIRVPLKHGLYTYDSLDTADFDDRGDCIHKMTIESARHLFQGDRE